MLFLPHNKNRPNYHPAVGQLCGSHHVTQTDESQSSSQPEGKKNNKTKHAYFYDWEGTAWGETDGTYNFSKHIVVSYSKIQQMLLKARERERERSVWRYCGSSRTFVLESPISEAVGQTANHKQRGGTCTLRTLKQPDEKKHHAAAIITSPA